MCVGKVAGIVDSFGRLQVLKRIKAIAGLGRFKTFKHPGGTESELRRVSLIYARNGSGKSTLAAVLRGCGAQSADPLRKLWAVESSESPRVALQHDGGTSVFKDWEWTGPHPRVRVFDREFVEANVSIGREIRKEQRVGLLDVALGTVEVESKRELQELAQRRKDLNERHTELMKLVAEEAEEFGLSAYQYRHLPPCDDWDALELKLEKVTADAHKAKELFRRCEPEALPGVPAFPMDAFADWLSSTPQTVAKEAQRKVKEHLDVHFRDTTAARSWISSGLRSTVESDSCPFCGQDTSNIELLEYFAQVFAKETQNQSRGVKLILEGLRSLRIWWDDVKRIGVGNLERYRQWGDVVDRPVPVLGSQGLNTLVEASDRLLRQVLDQKRATPMLVVDGAAELQQVTEHLVALASAVSNYNEIVVEWCTAIKPVLTTASRADLERSRRDLRRLKAGRKRHGLTTAERILSIESLEGDIRLVQKGIVDARKRLSEDHAKELTGFVEAVNDCLEDLGTEFRLAEPTPEHGGGRPGVRFQLVVGQQSIPVVGGRHRDRLSTLLSEGDRNALGFAVFVAAQKRDTQLEESIIVFDDPMTSFDEERLSGTVDEIYFLSRDCSQVVVLSHNPMFLMEIAEAFPKGEVREMELCRPDSGLVRWDAEAHCSIPWIRVRKQLQRFVDDSALDDRAAEMRGAVRKLLEGFLRIHWPESFARNLPLSTYLKALAKDKALAESCGVVGDRMRVLQRLAKWSAKEHHDDSSVRRMDHTADGTRGQVKKALAWIRV